MTTENESLLEEIVRVNDPKNNWIMPEYDPTNRGHVELLADALGVGPLRWLRREKEGDVSPFRALLVCECREFDVLLWTRSRGETAFTEEADRTAEVQLTCRTFYDLLGLLLERSGMGRRVTSLDPPPVHLTAHLAS
jgi:hypothetical protein